MNPLISALLQPGVIYGSATVCLLSSVLLFVWTKLHFRALERHLVSRQAEVERAAELMRLGWLKMSEDFAGMERQSLEVAGVRPAHGLNLSKRSHALRMHRRGDQPDQIASTLNVPRQEVELLLKVHRIVVASV